VLRIPCPYCGTRDQAEFHFGGESHIQRPKQPEDASDAQWADYLFYRDNPKGVHYERWVHRFGCRQWFNLARDTVTHEIIEVYRMGEQPGSRGAGKGGPADG
jgi:heterotetrameric sarcosine oxidase delta subunit